MLHTLKKAWPLRVDDCPCDVEFVEWLRSQDLRGQMIFHFGTGEHHLVGRQCAQPDLDNAVLGITATPKEHDAYVKLAIRQPELVRRYWVCFGDIYNIDERLIPPLDIATLFHLCEFRDEKNDRYGALTDPEMLDLIASRIRPNGYLLFYTKSYAYPRTQTIIETWSGAGAFEEAASFGTLRVFQRTSA